VKLSKGKRLKPVLGAEFRLDLSGCIFQFPSQHQFGSEEKAIGMWPSGVIAYSHALGWTEERSFIYPRDTKA
jgi:hypothetical protein